MTILHNAVLPVHRPSRRSLPAVGEPARQQGEKARLLRGKWTLEANGRYRGTRPGHFGRGDVFARVATIGAFSPYLQSAGIPMSQPVDPHQGAHSGDDKSWRGDKGQESVMTERLISPEKARAQEDRHGGR